MQFNISISDDSTRTYGELASKTVNRISYGVVFKYQDDMKMISEYWSHIFIIKLPKKTFGDEQSFIDSLHADNTPVKALCMHIGNHGFYSEEQRLSACRRFENHVQYLITSETKGYANLHALVDDIYSLLPNPLTNQGTATTNGKQEHSYRF